MLTHRVFDRSALLLILFNLLSGCAEAPRPAPPPQWPATFSGRTLFFSSKTLVYARDGSTADALARRVTDVGRDFTQSTGATPTSGLVIVNDLEDSKIGNLDLEKLLPHEKQEPDLAALGFTTGEFVMAIGLPVDKEKFAREPGFTEPALRSIRWVVSIPSDRRVDRFGRRLIDAALKKQNLNFFQQLVIMPFMPLIRGLLNDALHAERDTAIYQCFCESQTGWTEERREKELTDYQNKRMGEVISSLKATTQQVSQGTGK